MYKTEFDINSGNSKKQSAASKEVANEIIQQTGQRGTAYLKSCESFLRKNIDDYPLYANSSAYDESGSVFDLKGTDKIGII